MSRRQSLSQPYAVLGAGELVSHLQKNGNEVRHGQYRFNVFRLTQDSGEVSHVLGPSDLQDIVKLCQVLAFTIADDGCLPADLRQQLFDLADDLDLITKQWSNFNGWQDRA
jgi:hypothetical protein